jgi:hypothetical protein
MENVIFGIIVVVAVWYVIRYIWRALKHKNASCGCGDCDSCPAAPKTDGEKTTLQ